MNSMLSKLGIVFVLGLVAVSGCSSMPSQAVVAPGVAENVMFVAPRIASSAPFVRHEQVNAESQALGEAVPVPVNASYTKATLLEPSTLAASSSKAVPVYFSSADREAVPSPTPTPLPMVTGKPETVDEVRQSLQVRPEYVLGAGDVIKITVLDDNQVSGTYTVGPDGKIAVPIAGVVMLAGLTREQAADSLAKALVKKIENPSITINIIQYKNNHVFVLGRVLHPGQQELAGEGRLLQALAAAGVQTTDRSGIPSQTITLPPRCSIIRGNQQAIWIDLKRLLTGGDLSLNVALANNDLIFLPDIEDEYVYVMGSVGKPGAIPFRSKLSLIDAISMAGGITNDGRYNDVIVSRRQSDGEFGAPQEYDIRRAMEKGMSPSSLELNAGDVVYVRRSNMAKVGLFFQRVGPGIQLMSVGTNLFSIFKGNTTGQTTNLSTGGTTQNQQAP